ncbi:MAG TPA: heme-binding protein [Tepidisphaeraceae bacterium]|nr:heme-binding protein [Tepidisphaeraceae bacterium]
MNRRRISMLGGGVLFLSLAIALGLGFSANSKAADAPQGGGAPPQKGAALPVKDISLDQAQKAVAAAVKKSQELHINEDIAIVDAGGNLKAFARMDNAWLGSIDIAIKKARTARYFDMPTGEIGKLSQPGGPLYQIEVSNGGLITFPGGVPLRDSTDAIIGAVGASGSTVDNDHAVAQAAVDALK